MKIRLLASVLGLALTSGMACAAPASASSAPAAGTTTEVRYVSSPAGRKGAAVSKIVITRDASGRIISVKRG